MKKEDAICYVCGAEADYECDRCEQPICDDCTAKRDGFNNLEKTLCEKCYNFDEDLKSVDWWIEEHKRMAEEARKVEITNRT